MNAGKGLTGNCNTTVPEVYPELLPRKNISRILDGASPYEVVCLIAPYGYGKTLAVLSWLKERGLRAAWLTLDKTDNSGSVKDMLLEAAARHTGDGAQSALVIDNFQFIRDEALLRFVKDFIYDALGRWRVIVISRAELPPVFNDLMLKGHICLVTQKELEFGPDEIMDYFELNKHTLSRRDVERLYSDTEGWPSALNVVLTVSRGGQAVYGQAARAYVDGFFETEIWSELSESVKDFLLRTSVLDILTPSACRAITETGATLPILNWLIYNGIFISRLDERDTYRYHRVFQSFLAERRKTSGVDEQALFSKIAWWLYEKGDMEQSFPYFFKAGDLYGMSQVLKEIDPSTMGIERFLELTERVTELDAADLKPYPVIVSRMAMIQYLKGNLAEMQALCKTFLEWIDPGALQISPEEYAECVWEAGWLCYLNPDEAVLNNPKHENWTNYKEYVPHLRDRHRARCSVLSFPTMLRGARDYCSVLGHAEDFLRHAKETGRSPVRDEASLWETHMIVAEYAYETEDYEKAEGITRRIMPLAEQGQLTNLCFVCTALLTKLLRAANAPEEIGALTARLEAKIMNRGEYFLLPNFRAFTLRNDLAAGRAGMTEAFEKENMPHADKPYYYLLYRHIALVRALLSTGAYHNAMLILGNLELLCHKYERVMDLIEVNILQATALFGANYEESARGRLRDALERASPYGFIRIFSDDAANIWPILELIRKRNADKHMKSVVISCKKALSRAGGTGVSKGPERVGLTRAELKVLKSLAAGMSYKEIAQDSGIQMSTVKSHVHSVYSKLEVDNKTAAILAARGLGIIGASEDPQNAAPIFGKG